MSSSHRLILVLVAVWVLVVYRAEACYPNGKTACLQLRGYIGYQWSTCLTDSYILEYSKGSHGCSDTVTSCYYQCMLESHDKENGIVYDSCSCREGQEPGLRLPTSCYSPDGTSCSWYSDCLETRHPCPANYANGYAVQYASEFCRLYSGNRANLTAQGQRWLDAVRKCIQVKLVPIIRPYVDMTCTAVKTFALETHPPCYQAPYPGEPSICDLALSDWGKIFWTVKGGFKTAVIPSLKGLLNVTNRCPGTVLQGLDYTRNSQELGLRMFRLTAEKIQRDMDYGPTADIIVHQLANHFEWKNKGVQWFAFIGQSMNANEVPFDVLLGSRSMYDIKFTGVSTANMTEILDDLAFQISNGTITFTLDYMLSFTRFTDCLDLACQNINLQVTPNIHVLLNDSPATKMSVVVLILASILNIIG